MSTGLSTQHGERTSAPNTGPSDGIKVLRVEDAYRETALSLQVRTTSSRLKALRAYKVKALVQAEALK